MITRRKRRTGLVALLGGVVGVAFVAHEHWMTQAVGFLVGSIGMLSLYLLLYVLSSTRNRNWSSRAGSSDDRDLSAYRIDRIWMDDGKPW